MDDPTFGVPQGLLPHVHLQSSFAYPYTPAPLQSDQALDHLLRAPQIIREHYAVAWTYINQPQDGTVILTWQPKQLGNAFATDGYIWGGAEKTFTQEIRGYTIQIFVHESGFIPGVEAMAAHRRVRYILGATPNNQSHDPSLQIVHYTQNLQEHRIPSRMLEISPEQHQQAKERRYLEAQGPLVRKEFMLNDKNNWPQIAAPGASGPGNTYHGYARPGMPQFARTPSGPQTYPSQPQGIRHGSIGASPAKPTLPPLAHLAVARPGHVRPAIDPNSLEELLENEWNPEYGDILDFLTPGEISATRYKQHHEWMEEILSSPYTTDQIMPVTLNLRLTGTLGELTEGLWDRKDGKIDHTTSSFQISPEKLADFDKRVERFVKQGEEQLAAMKQEHAQTMEQLTQQRPFADLERRLAELPFEKGGESLDEIAKEVEHLTGMIIAPREEVKQVQSGGLLNKGEENGAANNTENTDEFADFTNLDNLDTAGDALTFFDDAIEYPS